MTCGESINCEMRARKVEIRRVIVGAAYASIRKMSLLKGRGETLNKMTGVRENEEICRRV